MSGKKYRATEVPTKAQIEETRTMCEGYNASLKRLDENHSKLKKLRKIKAETLSEFESILYDEEIKKIEAIIKKDEESTAFFRWSLSKLDDRAQSIMRQLYIEGYAWDSIENNYGDPVPVGTVGRIRKQSIERMALEISEKRAELGM